MDRATGAFTASEGKSHAFWPTRVFGPRILAALPITKPIRSFFYPFFSVYSAKGAFIDSSFYIHTTFLRDFSPPMHEK